MNTRLARRLAGLYPREWRSRYGEEFERFMETHPSNFRTILDVIGGAMREHILSLGRFKTDRRQNAIAAFELVLIFPAALFLSATLVSAGHNPQYDLGNVAERVTTWYVARTWTLWLLLLALPFAALVSGGVTLLRSWNRDVELPHAERPSLATITPAPLATLSVAVTTVGAGVILAIVALHMLAN